MKREGDLAKVGGHLAAPPVLADGDLFVATVVGRLLRLRQEDGELQGTYEVGSELRFSPIVSEGRLYVSSQDGRIVCIKVEAVTGGGIVTLAAGIDPDTGVD